VRAYDIGAAINTKPTITDESRAVLLNQDATTVPEARHESLGVFHNGGRK